MSRTSGAVAVLGRPEQPAVTDAASERRQAGAAHRVVVHQHTWNRAEIHSVAGDAIRCAPDHDREFADLDAVADRDAESRQQRRRDDRTLIGEH